MLNKRIECILKIAIAFSIIGFGAYIAYINGMKIDKPAVVYEKEYVPVSGGGGKIISNGKTIEASDVFSYTDYIPVEPKLVVTIKNLFPSDTTGLFIYDKNKVSKGRIRCGKPDETLGEFTTVIPEDIWYIRYNITNKHVKDNKVYISRDKGKPDFEDFKDLKSKHGPILTIIDDDTLSLYQVDTFYAICEMMGIKGTYAVITDKLNTVDGLKERLHQYENNGYQMITHCREQKRYLLDRDDEGLTKTYDNISTAKKMMGIEGFKNSDYWVSPYGMHDDYSRKIAKELGFKCLISVTQLTYEGYTPYYDRWFIPRMELYPTDKTGNQTLEDIKKQIDQCVETNGWLLVCTHLSQWPKEDINTGYQRIKEMIQYAKDSGMTAMTLSEAFEYWKPIYEYYENKELSE